jgi:hypothetical protein
VWTRPVQIAERVVSAVALSASGVAPKLLSQGAPVRDRGAGIVTGYLHVCRARVNKSGRRDPSATRCGHSESVADKARRRCPQHGDLLWPKPQVRQIRFHDLRDTCASLLLQSGCSLAAVSRVLGHADVRITLERYGHLAPDFMQAEVAKMRMGVEAPEPVVETPVQAAAVGETGGSSCARVAAKAAKAPEGESTLVPGNEKARGYRAFRHSVTGAGNRIRTGDPQLGKLMLYQLSYSRVAATDLPRYRGASQGVRAARRGALDSPA